MSKSVIPEYCILCGRERHYNSRVADALDKMEGMVGRREGREGGRP